MARISDAVPRTRPEAAAGAGAGGGPDQRVGAGASGKHAGPPRRAGHAADPDPLVSALLDVGDRWTLLVVDALLGGPLRFNDLQDELPGIATNVLAKRLAHLEQRGLVVGTQYSARPPRFAYELTGAGRELAGPLRLLRSWGARATDLQGGAGGGPEHSACGSPLEPRWWCPTCDRVVGDDEAGEVRFV